MFALRNSQRKDINWNEVAAGTHTQVFFYETFTFCETPIRSMTLEFMKHSPHPMFSSCFLTFIMSSLLLFLYGKMFIHFRVTWRLKYIHPFCSNPKPHNKFPFNTIHRAAVLLFSRVHSRLIQVIHSYHFFDTTTKISPRSNNWHPYTRLCSPRVLYVLKKPPPTTTIGIYLKRINYLMPVLVNDAVSCDCRRLECHIQMFRLIQLFIYQLCVQSVWNEIDNDCIVALSIFA